MNVLAIDIGGTKIATGLVDLNTQTLLERQQFPTPIAHSASQFAHHILEHCQHWLPEITQIGVSTTGLVTEEGISAINPDTLSFPTPFPLRKHLSDISNKPVQMLNDAQAAAWYEYLQLDNNYSNMAYITVSTGVGGGLVLNRTLHTGRNNFAGHIGHTVVEMSGEPCGCGQHGCVEAIASGTAINKQAQRIKKGISNIELFDMASREPEANAIIQRSAEAVATLCCNLKATLDLDAIVLGGGVGLATGYFERVKQAVNDRPSHFQLSILKAKGSHDACLLGAAFLLLEH
ncbi:N-acetylmannosamine kinase [Vibrio nigripulchritudo]|uniref:N-acetylmannosamine kinase n=1 Tax=Vibrio nigripulchritudo TaxID=28173 RepID=UPI0003B2063B|nr:N-acetylmannosamine kinase [Vibrio nigripulchritudo]CCN68520.1 N-acetylmannosamine kinase [Vibrio nigripulchritudo SFn118]